MTNLVTFTSSGGTKCGYMVAQLDQIFTIQILDILDLTGN